MIFEASLENLDHFADSFWSAFKGKKLFAFYGEMGAGKTTMITALCKRKGVKDAASSPTFSIINEYSFSENGQLKKIFHMDLYRLNSLEEIVQAGVEDCLFSNEICFVEWPQKAPELLPDETVHVFIEAIDSNTRQVKVETSHFPASSI